MMTIKTQNYECCMCGDHGLSNQLFRCKVCHFRSQHRYCSNLYPKAESYRVCNWCLIQKDDHPTLTTTSNYTNSSKKSNSVGIIKLGLKPKSLQPTSPIKKPNRSPETGSPLGRKRINSPIQNQDKFMTKTKSEELSNNNNNNNNNNNSGSSSRISSTGGGGGPSVIKHVFRNKVRRYKLLDEVSS